MLNSLVCSGTHVTQQLRYNDLRLFVGISSNRKPEQLINFWKHEKAVSWLQLNF